MSAFFSLPTEDYATFGVILLMTIVLLHDRKRLFPRNKPLRFTLNVFVIVAAYTFALSVVSSRLLQASLRNRVKAYIAECGDEMIEVYFDDEKFDAAEPFLSDMERMLPVRTNHSGPRTSVIVELRCRLKSLNFLMRQDSRYDEEFWVYTHEIGKESQRGMRIGNIRSSMLRNWLKHRSHTR